MRYNLVVQQSWLLHAPSFQLSILVDMSQFKMNELSIAFNPVCIGSLTDCLGIIPGALT